MDNLEYWREALLECLEADLEFSMKLERYQIQKFAGLFLGCCSPNTQPNPTSGLEAEILRFIFHVIHRASFEAPEITFSPTAAFLIDFAKVYAASNPEAVKEVISKFLATNSGLESDFICARTSMVDYLKSITKKLEKTGHKKIDPTYRTFVIGLFANIGQVLSTMFSSSAQVCRWFNQTSDFLASSMAFYDSITQLIILEPLSFDGGAKEKFLSAIHLSLETRYFSPIKGFGTSPSTRVSLFDQMYSLLSKQFSPDDECQLKRVLFDAPLVADLSLTYDYPNLLPSLDSTDLACRKTKLDGLVSLFDSTLFGLQREPSSPPSYCSTTDVESDEDILLESAISQVLDIFPDLKASFVKLCFEKLGADAEALIAQILEDSLPQDLKAMKDQPDPSESILATRRNIHDNDEFDLLAPGRKKAPLEGIYRKQTSMQPSTLRLQEDLKASTIQLVYNQYEDEYDDTYDQDIQGPAEPGDALQDPSLKHEATLYSVFSDTPNLFQKSKEARASKARASLRNTTGMSDEQLEGWASMLRREPSRQRKLGAKHGIETETFNNHDQPVVEQAAPPRAPPAPVNKAYKDRNKARFANHRRKDMHQKKLDKA